MTERKLSSDATVAALQRFYDGILENIDVDVAVFDLDLRYRYVNTNAIQDPEVRAWIIGKTDLEYCAHRGKPAHIGQQRMQLLQRALDEDRTIEFAEEMVNREGETRHFTRTIEPIKDADGNIELLLGYGVDVTTSKRAEATLKESEARFRAFAETAADSVVIIDEKSRILFVNPATERIFGYRAGEILHRSLTMLMPDRFRAHHLHGIGRYVNTSKRHLNWTGLEISGLHRDGHEIPLEISFGETSSAQGRLFIGIIRDVSDRKQLEEQLRQSQKLEAIGQLAGGIAHDFNNLLTAIMGHGALLASRSDLTAAVRTEIQEINNAAERAAGLTRQLLAFSRKQVLQPEVLNLNATVQDMERMLQRLIGEDIELITNLCKDIECVRADRGQIQQVIVNLVVNARDAMPKGGRLTIRTKNAELTADHARRRRYVDPGSFVLLEVSDTGPGIDPTLLERIFEPFYTTKDIGKGTGLGLSTVYGIVKQSDGYVWADNSPDGGAVFSVYLPAVAGPADAAARPSMSSKTHEHSETILVAEDDPSVRRLVRRILSGRGYTVLEGGSDAEVLRLCETHDGPIHLLITDVVMPGMGGIELAGRVVKLRPDLEVLFMSGYTKDQLAQRGVLEPGIAFMEKPFTPDLLCTRVREILEGAEKKRPGAVRR